MSVFNAAVRPIFDLLQAPLRDLPAFVGILLWSIPVGIGALWVFKKSSNQERIAAVKKKIFACLFEIRLFNDDVRAILRAQGETIRHVLHYQALALKPMLWILPPLVIVMVQLHAFYGFRGLRAGDSVRLRVELANDWQEEVSGSRPPISLELPDGLRAATPAVWVPSLGEIDWLIAVDEPGDYQIGFSVAGQEITKSLRATDRVVRLSPTRPDRSFLGQLEWPSEPPLPASSPIRSIALDYPDRSIGVLWWSFEWRYAWMVLLFVLSMVIGFALRKPMGVEI